MSKNFLPLKNRQIAQNRDSNPLASRTGKQAPLIRAFCKSILYKNSFVKLWRISDSNR